MFSQTEARFASTLDRADGGMDGVRGFVGEGEGGRQGPGRTVTSRVREGGVIISDGGAERVPHLGLKTQVDEPVPWFLKPGTQTRDHEGREACGLCLTRKPV